MVLAKRVRYRGNPMHKRNPGDFALVPPAAACPAKSLCDAAQIFDRAQAERLLQEGVCHGLVSEQEENGWPKVIWAVSDNGLALEARLDNAEQGTYHGYPIPPSDPFAREIVRLWQQQATHG